MSTKGQIIQCKAAVVRSKDKQSIETIQVHPPKSNEVRVQVKACGLCGSDAHIYRQPPPYAQFPVVLGHEVAGIVESVGDKVKSVSAGDHVMVSMIPQCGKCELCEGDYTNFCDGGTADGNAEKFTMPDGTTRLLELIILFIKLFRSHLFQNIFIKEYSQAMVNLFINI
jgi:Zn-dependent alcohol dehydrogenase